MLRMLFTDVSGQAIVPFFNGQAVCPMAPEDGTARLFRNIGKQLPTHCVTTQNSEDLMHV